MELGYKLKKIRENRRFSQQELADYLGICQKTYSNIESCKTKLSIEQLILLSDFLKFNLEDVLKEHKSEGESTFSNSTNAEIELDKVKYLEKIIEKYEVILRDKSEIIRLLKEKIERLEWDNENKYPKSTLGNL